MTVVAMIDRTLAAPGHACRRFALTIVLSIASVASVASVAAAAPEPLPKGTLSGTVVDAAGKPVAGARVVMERGLDAATNQAKVMAETVTGADGRFRLGPVEPVYRAREGLRVQADGYAAQVIGAGTCSVFPGSDCDLGRIQLDRGRTFVGQVLDPDGKPVGGADVECNVHRIVSPFHIGAVIPPQKLTTDAEGRVRTPPLPVGLVALNVRATGWRSAAWDWQRAAAAGGEVVLPPLRLEKDVPIAGVVQDEQGRPIAGARISAGEAPDTTSDAAGRFVLRGFGPNPQFQFFASKAGCVPVNWGVKSTDDGLRYREVGSPTTPLYPLGPVKELKVVMKPVAWIEGRAVDGESGAPVHLDRVLLCDFVRKPNGEIVLSGCHIPKFEQPERGRFRVPFGDAREWHLTLSAAGYQDGEALTPPLAELKDIGGITVRLKRKKDGDRPTVATQRIAGAVTRNGEPVKTGWVGLWRMRRATKVSDVRLVRGRTVEGQPPTVLASAPIRNGAYVLDVPYQDDAWHVVAEEPGQPVTLLGPIRVALGEQKKLDIACTPGGGISGVVAGVPPEWAGHAWVVAFSKSGLWFEARADAEGHFNLTLLPPGEYGVKSGHDAFDDVEVRRGKPPEVDAQGKWDKPAEPWNRATVVRVEADRETRNVRLELPPE